MVRLLPHLDFSLALNILIPFLLVFFVMYSRHGLSYELNQNQKEFTNSIESYNNLRAEIIVKQAKNELTTRD